MTAQIPERVGHQANNHSENSRPKEFRCNDAHTAVLMIVTAQDIVSKQIGHLKANVGQELRQAHETEPFGDPNETLEFLMGEKSQPLTVHEFSKAPESTREVITRNLLGPSPAAMIPHVVDGRQAILNYRLDWLSTRRGVAVVCHGANHELVSLVEGQLRGICQYNNQYVRDKTTNTIETFNLEEALTFFNLDEMAQALAERTDQYYQQVIADAIGQKPDRPTVSLKRNSIEQGLLAMIALPYPNRQNLPSHDELKARKALVKILNRSLVANPIEQIAHLAVAGTDFLLDESVTEVDYHPEVLQARQAAQFNWAMLLQSLPAESRFPLLMRVVDISKKMSGIAKEIDDNADEARNQVRSVTRHRQKTNHRHRMLDGQEQELRITARATTNEAQHAAQTLQFEQQIATEQANAEAATKALDHSRKAAKKYQRDLQKWYRQVIDKMYQLQADQQKQALLGKLNSALNGDNPDWSEDDCYWVNAQVSAGDLPPAPQLESYIQIKENN